MQNKQPVLKAFYHSSKCIRGHIGVAVFCFVCFFFLKVHQIVFGSLKRFYEMLY